MTTHLAAGRGKDGERAATRWHPYTALREIFAGQAQHRAHSKSPAPAARTRLLKTSMDGPAPSYPPTVYPRRNLVRTSLQGHRAALRGLPQLSGKVDRGQHPHAAQAVRASTNKASKEGKTGTATTATHVRAEGLQSSSAGFRPRLIVSARVAATLASMRFRVRVRLRQPTGFIMEKGTQILPEGCLRWERPLEAQPTLRRRYAHILRHHLRAHARNECNQIRPTPQNCGSRRADHADFPACALRLFDFEVIPATPLLGVVERGAPMVLRARTRT